MDFLTLNKAKKYTDDAVSGTGAIKGKNCTIANSVESDTGTTVNFAWYKDDGTAQTTPVFISKGAKGDKGDKGEQGEQGVPGLNGTDGIDGTNGIDGTDGVDGVSISGITDEQNANKVTVTVKMTDDTTKQFDFNVGNLYIGDTEPTDPNTLWIDTSQEYDDEYAKKSIVIVSDTQPTETNNKLWVDTSESDAILKYNTGNAYVAISSSGSGEGASIDDSTPSLNKTYSSSKVESIAEGINNKIGDISSMTVTSVTDLVSAINKLDASFMSVITYNNTDKKLVITYKNGGTTNIDLSAIITDTNIGELSNVNDDGITDNQVLAYDTATSKYKPFTIDTSTVLQDAKDYTDTEISKINVSDAISVDELPTYDASSGTPTITYKQSGVEKTTQNIKTWFYYHNDTDDKDYQTIFLNGIAFTLSVANDVDFNDYCKVSNVTDTYTGTETDKTKIASISTLDALKVIIDTAISSKVNTSDIVDNLSSDATDKPLSAKQGKTLDENKVDKVDGKGLSTNDYDNSSKEKVDSIPSDAKFTDTTYENATTSKDGLMSKEDKVSVNKIGSTDISTVSDGTLTGSVSSLNSNLENVELKNTELKMLGWTVPSECPIQNEVDGNTFIQKVGRVDLGSLTWNYAAKSKENYIRIYTNNNLIKGGTTNIVMVLNGNDVIKGVSHSTYWESMPNFEFIAVNNNKNIAFQLSLNRFSENSITAFKTAMQGVYLYYELATPIEMIIDGNEAITPTNMVSDAWSSSVTYGVNAYCIYNNYMWKCLVQHSNQTPSDGTYWTKVSIGSELNNLSTWKDFCTVSGSQYIPVETMISVFGSKPSELYIVVYNSQSTTKSPFTMTIPYNVIKSNTYLYKIGIDDKNYASISISKTSIACGELMIGGYDQISNCCLSVYAR